MHFNKYAYTHSHKRFVIYKENITFTPAQKIKKKKLSKKGLPILLTTTLLQKTIF